MGSPRQPGDAQTDVVPGLMIHSTRHGVVATARCDKTVDYFGPDESETLETSSHSVRGGRMRTLFGNTPSSSRNAGTKI